MPVAQAVVKPRTKLSGYKAELQRRDPAVRRDFFPATTVAMSVPNYDPDPYYATISKDFGKQYEKVHRKIEREARAAARAEKAAVKALELAKAQAKANGQAMPEVRSQEPAPERQTAEIHAFIAPEECAFAAPWEDVPPLSEEEARRFAAR
ncbi:MULTISPECIES: hypothetical protein [Burkholderia]|nr:MULTISPECIES: hypothetical protein [Burkholderia]ERJ38552.1 hypothetical protein L810_6768 [Burkholderia sp. AU4i]MBR8093225.1 hypothetical protein [Burkholderia cenocepacia]MBS6358850.1 hypothetical protein [Burkholderia sp.]MBY4712651.1 hypothetical protein [Burkholderia cepacia]MBY4738823.1 hypothetical protein [Burkholderia cepacia]